MTEVKLRARTEEVLDRYDVDVGAAIGLLVDLVDVPSATGNEASAADLLVDWGQAHGLEGRLQPIGENRFNALLSLERTAGAPSLLFNGHLDTSYSGEEAHLHGPGYEPRATVDGDWLFGLGSFNMKSGLAAATVATAALAKRSMPGAGSILVAGVAGEIETAAIDEYQGPAYTGYGYGTQRLLAHAAVTDFGIVCEPTDFKLSHGQLGALWLKVTVHGHMKHSVSAAGGVDHAVEKGLALGQAFVRWRDDYQRRHVHEGQVAAVNIGAIRGGWPYRISRTPHDCSLYLDVRFTPHQRPQELLAEITQVAQEALRESGGDQRLAVEPYVIVPSVTADPAAPVFDALRAAHATVFDTHPEPLFRGPMADSGHMNHAGVTTATYGLGAHGSMDDVNPETGLAGEQIRLADYLALVAVYLEAACAITAA